MSLCPGLLPQSYSPALYSNSPRRPSVPTLRATSPRPSPLPQPIFPFSGPIHMLYLFTPPLRVDPLPRLPSDSALYEAAPLRRHLAFPLVCPSSLSLFQAFPTVFLLLMRLI